jgi:hypothetical protein
MARWFKEDDPFYPSETVGAVAYDFYSHLKIVVDCFSHSQTYPTKDSYPSFLALQGAYDQAPAYT